MKLFRHASTVAMLLQNMNKLGRLCKTLTWGKRLCDCEKVVVGEGFPRRGEMREDNVIF